MGNDSPSCLIMASTLVMLSVVFAELLRISYTIDVFSRLRTLLSEFFNFCSNYSEAFASPAEAASMVALRASRLVCSAIFLINSVTSSISFATWLRVRAWNYLHVANFPALGWQYLAPHRHVLILRSGQKRSFRWFGYRSGALCHHGGIISNAVHGGSHFFTGSRHAGNRFGRFFAACSNQSWH